ncbi:predicted protein [Postia placenta Mad-698-R]|nr:predicted protein [Postia placenta Mad-698-R]
MPSSTYPTRQLGRSGPHVSAIGFGAMGLGAFYGKRADEKQAFETLSYAADRGVTFWDTADIYGNSEETLGKWFAQTGRRSEIFLATKFGSRDLTPGAANPDVPNSKPSYIKRQIENSFKALQTDWIDLYYQHRVDPEVPIEVVMETLRPYLDSGKIKYIGLSECSAEVLRRAKSVPGVGEKLIACQMEYSPFEVEIEKDGFLTTARELGVSIIAYSPLGRGLITGQFKSAKDFGPDDIRSWFPRYQGENFAKNLELADKFAAVGKKVGATPGQVALAWILAENPDFVPIPGTKTIPRLEENAKAAEVKLSAEDVKEVRKAVDAADVVGPRYPAKFMEMLAKPNLSLDQWKGEQ